MTIVKFDKSVKYAGVRHDAHTAFEVKDEDVAELKKAGAIVVSTTPPVTPPQTSDEDETDEGAGTTTDDEEKEDEDVAELKEKLLDYSIPELTKFAEEHNIDLQKKTRKADIYNIIVAAL